MRSKFILGALVVLVLIVILILIIIVVLAKSRNVEDFEEDDEYGEDGGDGYYHEDNDDDDNDDGEYDDGEEQRERERRSMRRREERERARESEMPDRNSERRRSAFHTVKTREPQQKKVRKRQWKIILENLESWEKYTYIFYDNIGIGRGRRIPEFEKYITIQDDPRISKLHCAIIRDEDKLYLKDMGSRNGTYLNGEKVRWPAEIQRDDIIEIGQTKIEVKKVLRERE